VTHGRDPYFGRAFGPSPAYIANTRVGGFDLGGLGGQPSRERPWGAECNGRNQTETLPPRRCACMQHGRRVTETSGLLGGPMRSAEEVRRLLGPPQDSDRVFYHPTCAFVAWREARPATAKHALGVPYARL
jgi:hypothetical protein